jgi:hypothetical protein
MEELKYRCSLRTPSGGLVEKILTKIEMELLQNEGWQLINKVLYDEKTY